MLDQSEESDLRKRAAWLLLALAVVAALFVLLLVVLLGRSKHHGSGPADTIAIAPPATSAPSTSAGSNPRPSSPASTSGSSAGPSTRSCPGSTTCVLQGDPGSVVAAVNAYRTKNHLNVVSGKVSSKAQKCALSNGEKCTGGWVESEVAKLDGKTAVKQIANIARNGLLAPDMKSFEVGWAYAPRAHEYYIAVISNA